ncbi:terpene synthase family protein [Chitinophaga sp. NPDC101104]|uniref:terpene synthase family protein n=1 Tax=Chitinophaga sp. NPDC101104 TaxID=3390561 RepID=UPI003D01B5B5
MQTLQLPQIFCPFPSMLNPFAKEAEKHTAEWAARYGLVKSEKARERFNRARFAMLSSRAFPTAGRFELCIAAEFNTWLFLLDDKNDESMFGKVDYLQMVHSFVSQILRNSTVVAPEEGMALAGGFADLWKRMRRLGSPSWQQRFVKSMTDYLDACLWEVENRIAHKAPSVADYIEKRPYTGALYADIELIEILENIYLPDEVRNHDVVQQLSLACNNVVCWANDLFSFDKERRQGDVHNLVVVLKEERSLTLESAVAEAARMHDEEVRRFIMLSESIPNFGEEVNDELQRYVGVLKAWMRANLDWSFGDTARYRMHIRETASGNWLISRI